MSTQRFSHLQNELYFSRKLQTFNKQTLSPASTVDSESPRFHQPSQSHGIRQNKQKSQLCKKFVENGSCPYQGKCKFAHGSHELRKNSQLNSKYKTKECDIYINEGYCIYGERCNFIHNKEFQREDEAVIDMEWIEMKGKKGSRLMQILQQ